MARTAVCDTAVLVTVFAVWLLGVLSLKYPRVLLDPHVKVGRAALLVSWVPGEHLPAFGLSRAPGRCCEEVVWGILGRELLCERERAFLWGEGGRVAGEPP